MADEDAAAIQRLQTTPPSGAPSGWVLLARWLSPVSALIATAAIVVAMLSSRQSDVTARQQERTAQQAAQAASQATDTADCVNTVLATKNKPATDEVNAQISKAETDLAALHQIANGSGQAGFTAYTESTRQYIVALRAIKAERAAHPLGKC